MKLRPIEDHDTILVEGWLSKPHVQQWFHDPGEWLREIKEREGTFRFLNHYIVTVDGQPIGFCQYYDCWDAQEEWYDVPGPGVMYSIDYMIGEEFFLGKGYGKEIVRRLLHKIAGKKSDALVVVQPEEGNVASCKALTSNGFVYDSARGYYRHQITNDPNHYNA